MKIPVSRLLKLGNVEGVKLGSLVLAPDDNETGNQWAIRAGDKAFFQFKTNRLSNSEITIANFGTAYTVMFDPNQCCRLPYPWDKKKPPQGSLCIFSDGEAVCCSILFGAAPGGQSLEVFVFEEGKGKTGYKKNLELGKDHGVVFPNWRIGLKDADAPGGYKWVYKFSANDNE